MPKLTVSGGEISCDSDESVLDALLKNGVAVPHSCRKGVCRSCTMRAMKGRLPAKAQAGLKPTQVHEGYFLACQCLPDEDLTLADPSGATAFRPATVVLSEPYSATVQRLILQPEAPLDYHAGQFVNLRRADGLIRSYSLASLPGPVPEIELHVKRLQGGAMSGWIADTLHAGDTVGLSEPQGSCFYLPGRAEQNILMIGTGTGAAPLAAVARAALRAGHKGDIHLYHGSGTADGLYLHHRLRDLHAAHGNFHYHPCVSGNAVPLP